MSKSIPLAKSDYRRAVAQEPSILLRNRFVENDPTLADRKANYSQFTDANIAVPSYIQRPGLRFWQTIGDGQIRADFSAPGTFDDDLFVVSGNSLYRVHRIDGTSVLLASDLAGAATNDAVRMDATGDIGTIGPRMWIVDGEGLRVYSEDGFAQGRLTGTAIVDNDVVQLGTIYYEFTSGSVNAGAPAGTMANPWLVKTGGSLLVSLQTLLKAINDTGVNGTDYSTALVVNPDALAMTVSPALGLLVRAIATGTAGNAVLTSTTAANVAWWDGAHLTAGGSPSLIEVPLPDGVGAIDVAVINNFVVVIPAQGQGINGRFYWVNPGEVVIDPLDFATAERSPDPVFQVVVFSDQFWLPGQNTTEVYYMSGDPDAPVTRFQGVVFDRGVHPGCAIRVFDSMVLIDSFGGVYQIKGGENKISTPDIEERIRRAIMKQNILIGG